MTRLFASTVVFVALQLGCAFGQAPKPADTPAVAPNSAPECPKVYEDLCKAVVKPEAGGGLGSHTGNGSTTINKAPPSGSDRL